MLLLYAIDSLVDLTSMMSDLVYNVRFYIAKRDSVAKCNTDEGIPQQRSNWSDEIKITSETGKWIWESPHSLPKGITAVNIPTLT